MDLAALRQEYSSEVLDMDSADSDPYKQFERWFKQAMETDLLEPNAMTLATVDTTQRPTARTVLLKTFDSSGFVFYTNYTSRKSQHIDANPHVTLLFLWLPLQRQVEISGVASKISTAESMKYFMVRPRGSQLGAWISHQSSVISSRKLLESKLLELKAKFAGGEIPLPDFWGGYRIKPYRMEFWQGGASRLHDRIEYKWDNDWQRNRLSP